jgi:hypothetical protein
MGLEIVRTPKALNGAQANAHGLGDHAPQIRTDHDRHESSVWFSALAAAVKGDDAPARRGMDGWAGRFSGLPE